ncbi:MAG TPA: ABC transporter substrate-binding protein [Gemmatimonadaceae bacterium]|nr:ABC transporter substrate-binding protein [Gemmatimonadaceae bacterium]
MTDWQRGAVVALAVLAALSAIACSSGGAAGAGPLDRVVCVSKQINEFVYEIGAEGHIVARDLTSIYPAEITKLPSVGYHRALSAEGIISMKPTLLLTDGNVGPDAVLDQVKKVGIPVDIMSPGRTLDSAQQLMLRLGERFGRTHEADSIVARWRAGMDSIWQDTARFAAMGHGTRPRVLFLHFGQIGNTYLALKSGQPADQMLRWAGGVNAIDSVGGMTRVTPELIAKAAPDVIIATEVGFDRFGSVDRFLTMPGIALTPAGRSKKIYRITEQEIMYYGPRTPAVVRELADMIHR